MVPTEVHPIGLPSPYVLPTHLTLNSGVGDMFRLYVIDHVGPLVADMSTFCTLKLTLCVPVEHSLNGLIEVFK